MSSPKKPKASTRTPPSTGRDDTGLPAYRARRGVHGHAVAEASSAFHVDPQARIALIRHGVPAASIGDLSARMGISKEILLSSLGLSRATISRKEKHDSLLSRDESERVLGVEMLIGKVQAMVEESGAPEGFDAARWFAAWLVNPAPTLAGATPASYMDTFEGQRMLADLLAMSQSGVYA
ncbi:antitoxin Xre-like helix-turn-helix domain-containing protein [Massilia sp. HP4]|uniref:antitoxin Xre-like helix-turn-helix domain-containing protein n=1 Tax=Massilia sp. HP4 TaxID=2562316 RepID=UPI001E60C6C7|nr:antitoxin Xre-like helix-turn-helix domain-containing protein [Massilia sp. HP4]